MGTIVGAALCGRPIGLDHVVPSDRAATEGRPYSCFLRRSHPPTVVGTVPACGLYR